MLYVICFLIVIILNLLLGALYYAATDTDRVKVSGRVQSLGGFDRKEAKNWQTEFNKPLYERLFRPIGDRFGSFFERLAPKNIYNHIADKIEMAGDFYGKGVGGFLLLWIGLFAFCSAMGIFFAMGKKVVGPQKIVVAVCMSGIGFTFPLLMLKGIIEERQELIRRQMPDVLDLLCVSVQAGLGFDGAMTKVVAKMKGPLIGECERLLQELRMGVVRSVALQRLAKRTGIPEMKMFTASLIQADKLGVGMSQILEIQAENMREMRRQRARYKAGQLPIKILAPTMFFIFPIMFVVVLGPAVMTVINSLGPMLGK